MPVEQFRHIERVAEIRPETGSIPTVERKRPTNAAASPLHMAPEDRVATTVSAKTASAKYSAGPNDMAAVASSGRAGHQSDRAEDAPEKRGERGHFQRLARLPLGGQLRALEQGRGGGHRAGVPTRMAVIDPP